MRKLIFTVASLLMIAFSVSAQVDKGLMNMAKAELKAHLTDANSSLSVKNLDALEIDKVKFGSRNFKLKGSVQVNELSDNIKVEDPLRFKTKIRLSLTNPELKYIKVHFPGDNFLFWPRYRKVIG